MSTFQNSKKIITFGYLWCRINFITIQISKIIWHILRLEGDCTAYKSLMLSSDKFILVFQMYISISIMFTMNEILEFSLQKLNSTEPCACTHSYCVYVCMNEKTAKNQMWLLFFSQTKTFIKQMHLHKTKGHKCNNNTRIQMTYKAHTGRLQRSFIPPSVNKCMLWM